MKCDSFMRNVSASEEDKVRERVELGRGWGGGRATKSLQERRGRRRVVHFLDYKKKVHNMDVVQVRPLRLPSHGFSETSRAPLDGRAACG